MRALRLTGRDPAVERISEGRQHEPMQATCKPYMAPTTEDDPNQGYPSSRQQVSALSTWLRPCYFSGSDMEKAQQKRERGKRSDRLVELPAWRGKGLGSARLSGKVPDLVSCTIPTRSLGLPHPLSSWASPAWRYSCVTRSWLLTNASPVAAMQGD
ncbi:hypothetical protein BU26DRAFT_347844 [Trematosphaeria pertusa]|uniref:Uncharacterized protein n=1 Tax=Trematosphaeria pertusa TaxID=390896 RepID=A0A6A6IB01_9PLEO|nr:uncharacterized protein BU26DRAFT_347844 [Trematosphaeria pertusa]KAF2247419.1 hypothetical protein BU26DRAFT_347844 [Trematosphaeria pertusa]